MEIPLPDMMRAWRERDFARGNPPRFERLMLKLWAFAAKRPRLYHALAGAMARLSRAARGRARTIEPVAADAGLDRACAISPPRKARPSSSFMRGRCERMLDERAERTRGPLCMGRIRAALGVASLDRARKASVERRLERHPRGTIPCARQAGPRGAHGAVHRRCSPRKAPTCGRCATRKEAVARSPPISAPAICRRSIRMGGDAKLAALPWRDAWDIERSIGPAQPGDRAALSRAVVAAAETGTLFLVSGPGKPDHAEFPPRGAHRSDRSGGYRRLVRGGLGPAAGDPRQGDAASRRQPDQRAVADGGYRADHRQRRARPAPAAGADPRLAGPRLAFCAGGARRGFASVPASASVMVQRTHPPRAKIGKKPAFQGRLRGGLQCVWPYG